MLYSSNILKEQTERSVDPILISEFREVTQTTRNVGRHHRQTSGTQILIIKSKEVNFQFTI